MQNTENISTSSNPNPPLDLPNDKSENHPESGSLIKLAPTSTRIDKLRSLQFAYHNSEVSMAYTPNVVVNLFDFGEDCKPVDEIAYYNPQRYPVLFTDRNGHDQPTFTVLNHQQMLVGRGPNYDFPWIEQEMFHALTPAQISDRQNLIAIVSSPNPKQIGSNDYSTRLSILAPFFQQRIPDVTRTSYHLQAMYHYLCQATRVPVYGVIWYSIGLRTMSENLKTDPFWGQNFYPVLAPEHNNMTHIYASKFIEYVFDYFGKPLLLVYCRRDLNRQLTAEPATVANPNPTQSHDECAWFHGMLSLCTRIDKQQMTLDYPLLFSDGEVQSWCDCYIPHYDFRNHLLDMLSYNLQVTTEIHCSLVDWSFKDWHCSFGYNLAILQFRRRLDVQSISYMQQDRLESDRQRLMWKWNIHDLRNAIHWTLKDICPYEALPLFFRYRVLAPFYDLMKDVYTNARVSADYIKSLPAKKDGERPYFLPSIIVNNSTVGKMEFTDPTVHYHSVSRTIQIPNVNMPTIPQLRTTWRYVAGGNAFMVIPCGDHFHGPQGIGYEDIALGNSFRPRDYFLFTDRYLDSDITTVIEFDRQIQIQYFDTDVSIDEQDLGHEFF